MRDVSIDYLSLLSYGPLLVEGICHIRSYTLKQIVQNKEEYDHCISLFLIDQSVIPNIKNQNNIFDLFLTSETMRAELHRCLTFFITEELVYSDDEFVVFDKDKIVGSINSKNFKTIKDAILSYNHIKGEIEKKPKFRNKKAEEIYKKIQRSKDSLKSNTSSLSLGDIVSSVCIYSNDYNLINIWDLTIYQLLDQFSRLNIKNQHDIVAQKWAAWGNEPFDFSLWSKSIQ